MKKYAIIHTLGCRLNTADSALIADRLERAGYELVQSAEKVDLIVINGCAVTNEAVRKSAYATRRFRNLHPEAFIVITGCSAELDPVTYQEGGVVDLVLTNPGKRDIVDAILAQLDPKKAIVGEVAVQQPTCSFWEKATSKFPFRNRVFLKIQEGCNNFCTYCIVPFARGPERSRNFEEVIQDCRQAVASGYSELVLTGVNTCAYSDAGRGICELVHEVCRIPGNFRVRLSSTEPHPNNLSLIDTMVSEPKVCRFLHLALQSGSDRILKAMGRRYLRSDYAEFVNTARKRIPGIHLGSDLITAFPGETQEDFEDGIAFIEQMEFANLHIFTYSPRPGTPATLLPGRIAPEVAHLRHQKLEEVAMKSRRKFAESQYGLTLPVIFETVDDKGMARGWSDNYLPVRVPASSVKSHIIVPVLATPENIGE